MNKVAIMIGHTKRSGGSMSVDGTSEWEYNLEIAEILPQYLCASGVIPVLLIRREEDYMSAVRDYARTINNDEYFNAAIELHFNSATPSVNGYEYIQDGRMGKQLAGHLLDSHEMMFPDKVNRGVKLPWKGRGRPLLRGLRPAVSICEPFFGTNREEWESYNQQTSKEKYAYALSVGISNYLDTL